LLSRSDIPTAARAVDEWFPGLTVSNASCFLREDFYASCAFMDGLQARDFFVVLFKRADDWAGMLSMERDKDSQVTYGRLGPSHQRIVAQV
jgi:hypothetical protein